MKNSLIFLQTQIKSYKTKIFSFVSVLLVSIFFITSVSSAVPSSVYKINVPEKNGKVQQRYRGKSNKTIIHVQDAHSSFEAQQNIAQLIESLVTQENISTVAVEGAAGEVNLSAFKSFPIKEARDSAARKYIKQGLFTAAEYSGVTTQKEFDLFGAEDANLYKNNFEVFYNTILKRDDILNQIEDIESILNDLKKPLYSKDLFSFDQSFNAFARNQQDLMRFMSVFFNAAQINLGERLLNYSNLCSLKEVLVLERKTNFELAEEEQGLLCERVLDVVSSVPEDKAKFIGFMKQAENEEISKKEFAQCVRAYALNSKLDISAYSYFMGYVKYLELYAQLDFSEISVEIWRAAREIMLRMAETENARQLAEYSYSFLLMRKLCRLEAAPEEVAYFNDNRSAFEVSAITAFLNDQMKANHIIAKNGIHFSGFEKLYSEIETFYKLADARNNALIENTLKRMEKNNDLSGVLLGGGYHTPGLTEQLRNKGVNYVVVTPSISSVKVDVPYIERMTGELFGLKAGFTAVSTINALATYIMENRQWFEDKFRQVCSAEAITKIMETMESISKIDFASESEILAELDALKQIDEHIAWDSIIESVQDVILESMKGKAISQVDINSLIDENSFKTKILAAFHDFFGVEMRRAVNTGIRDRYERILRDVRQGKKVDAILSGVIRGEVEWIEVEEIKSALKLQNSTNVLGQILKVALNEGDAVVIFQVPGISQDPNVRGIKQLNDNKNFGEERTNKLIALRHVVIRRVMESLGLSLLDKRIEGSYKNDMFVVNISDKKILKEKLDIAMDRIKKIMSVVLKDEIDVNVDIKDDVDYVLDVMRLRELNFKDISNKLNEIGVSKDHGIFAFELGVSFVGKIDKTQEGISAEDRLNAVIQSLQAIVINNFFKRENPDLEDNYFYTKINYAELVSKLDALRSELLFEKRDFFNKTFDGKFLLKTEIADILRKKVEWENLSPVKRVLFKDDESLYEKVLLYFSYLNVQDFIKTWDMDFSAAVERAKVINELAVYIETMLKRIKTNTVAVSVSAGSSRIDVKDFAFKARRALFDEAKNIKYTSRLAFHSRAASLKDPVYIAVDIKGMGVKNNNSFEIELQQISEAINDNDWERVGEISRKAADPVTEQFMYSIDSTIKKLVRAASDTGLNLEPGDILVYVGGDEAVFAIPEGIDMISPQLLYEISSVENIKVPGTFDSLRVAATQAANMFKKEFEKHGRKDAEDVAHAKCLVELEDGIKYLKDKEALGFQNYVGIQNENGKWILYTENTEEPVIDYPQEVFDANTYVDGISSKDFIRAANASNYDNLKIVCKKSEFSKFQEVFREELSIYQTRGLLDFRLIEDAQYDDELLNLNTEEKELTVLFIKTAPEPGSLEAELKHVLIEPDIISKTFITSILEALIVIANNDKSIINLDGFNGFVSVKGNLFEFNSERMTKMISKQMAEIVEMRLVEIAA